MTKLRSLGLTLLASLALVACVGTASASAAEINAEEYPVTISGGVSGGNHELIFAWNRVSCSTSNLSGNLTEATSTFDTTPTLSGCNFGGGSSGAWNMNGCKYRFNIGSGTMDIVNCNPKPSWAGGGEFPISVSYTGCNLFIPSQTGIGPVTFENSGTGVNIVMKAWNLKYTAEGFSCPGGSRSDGGYFGTWHIDAFFPGGFPETLWIE